MNSSYRLFKCSLISTTLALIAFSLNAQANTIELPDAAAAIYFGQVLLPGESYSSDPVNYKPRFIGAKEYQKYNFGDVISSSNSMSNDDETIAYASAKSIVRTVIPSISMSATTANGAAVQLDGVFTYFFSLNSQENKNYDVLVNAYGSSKSNAAVSQDGGYDYRFYGQINIDGLYTASVCSGDSSVRDGEICTNLFGEPVGTHNTFGEGIITLQSNQIYRVEMSASVLLQTWGGSGAGSVYVDPVFSLLDPTIQNVTFQFSDGIQNMAAPSAVPAPAAAWLFATGLPMIAVASRRRSKCA